MSQRSATEFLEKLRAHPLTFDVIIGDFGREAAARYVALVGEEERKLLGAELDAQGLPFFDEYRRLMFTLVADIAHLKRGMIDRTWAAHGRLTDEVLFAIKSHDVPSDLKEAITELVQMEVQAGLQRGYRRVRVVLPCNSLSDLLDDAVSKLSSVKGSPSDAGYRSAGLSPIVPNTKVSAHGVIQSAIDHLSMTGAINSSPYLVLGSSMARAQYTFLGSHLGLEVLPLTMQQQAVIDAAVVACIGGGPIAIGMARRSLIEQVIEPTRTSFPDLVVLEACTDFDFGLGVDSVRLLAKRMVFECYRGLLPPGP
jgi:hypothetical protein